jgi:putative transposase
LIAARIRGCFEEPLLFEGTCNSDIFNAWLERQLCPNIGETHVVVMDNASFHKGRRTRKLIEKTGAILLFLPPYSPDLNPIEHDFAALKKRREYNEDLSLDEIIKTYE